MHVVQDKITCIHISICKHVCRMHSVYAASLCLSAQHMTYAKQGHIKLVVYYTNAHHIDRSRQ